MRPRYFTVAPRTRVKLFCLQFSHSGRQIQKDALTMAAIAVRAVCGQAAGSRAPASTILTSLAAPQAEGGRGTHEDCKILNRVRCFNGLPGCHCRVQAPCCTGCQASGGCQEYRLSYSTVYEERQMTAYRLECETVYEERPVTTYRPVLETEMRDSAATRWPGPFSKRPTRRAVHRWATRDGNAH